ncbi:MAG: hypothetical protein V1861_06505 [Candidatus Micrarchaeota archaeon]
MKLKYAGIGILMLTIALGLFVSGCTKQAGEDLAENKTEEGPAANITIRIIQENASHGYWSPSGDLIVFDKLNPDGFYDVNVITPNGTLVRNITENNPGINQRHNGWPVWHPSGGYIVFQSEEEDHWGLDKKWMGHPGLGFFSNLYATTADGNDFWKLTDIRIKKKALDGIPIQASLNPQFNHDGTKLMWTERYKGGGYLEWGFWQIKMADFVTDDTPRLENITVVLRAEDFCRECNYINAMDFIDDEKILLTGNLDGQHVYGMDQYVYDLKTKNLTNIMNTPELWEEGSCYSNGKIVYTTNTDSEFKLDFNNPDWPKQPRTKEYWMMKEDGTNKQRLTFLNKAGSGDFEASEGRRTIVAECSFDNSGSRMLGIVGFDKRDDNVADFEVNLALFEFE